MTNLDDNEPENTDKVPVRFAIATPRGVVLLAASDLTPDMRATIIDSMRDSRMPDDMRATLATELDVDLAGFAVSADPEAPRPDEDAISSHEPGCACAEIHREQLWEMLDTAFGDEPHLWQAAAALFKLSAASPQPLEAAARREALEEVLRHIQHSLELPKAPLSPLEQLVADFRNQLNG